MKVEDSVMIVLPMDASSPDQLGHTSREPQFGWRQSLNVLLYASAMSFVFFLAQGYIAGVPLQFMLKDSLKLNAQGTALFGALSDIPLWFGFAFGFLRDRWRPFGKGDSAYFVGVAVFFAAVYLVMGYGPLTYGWLFVASLAGTVLGAIGGASMRGVLAAVAKQHGMTGRLAVIAIVTARLGIVVGSYVGSHLGKGNHREAPMLAAAGVSLLFAVFGIWKPKFVYPGGDEPYETVFVESNREAFRRLMRHSAIYVPALMILFWDFAPGWGTPLLYFLTNARHLTEDQYGDTMSSLSTGALIAALFYPLLCYRINIRPLLVLGTVLGVLGAPVFLLIHTPGQATNISFIAGFSCGVATCTYSDVLFRSCPKELEGVVVMLFAGAAAFAADTSDVFGSWLYDKGGFQLALTVTCATTAAILLFVPLIPRQVTRTMEGTPIVDTDVPAPEPISA